jgi:predicted ATPase
MNKTFRQLKRIEKGEFFLALLKNQPADIYLVNDISAGIHPVIDVRLKKVLDDLKNNGCLVILLTHDDILRMKSPDTGKYFYKSDSWCGIVERYAGMDEIKKALEVYK